MSQKQVFFQRNVKCGFFSSNINFFSCLYKNKCSAPTTTFFFIFSRQLTSSSNLWPQIDEMLTSIATSAARLGLSYCKPCGPLVAGFASALRRRSLCRIERSNCRHSTFGATDVVHAEPPRFNSNALSLLAAALCVASSDN